MALSSCATLRALAFVWPASHLPAAAVESSSDVYVMAHSPALLPRCLSASFSPRMTSSDCVREAPWSGSDE